MEPAYQLIAACFESRDAAKTLLSHKPELLHARTPHLDETPLHYLAAENHIEAVRGPNVNIVEALLRAGAEVHQVDGLGPSAPHLAAEDDAMLSIVERLLGAGADQPPDAFASTPSDVAPEHGAVACVARLATAHATSPLPH